MSREHHNGSRTGAAGALSALTRLLGAAAALLKRVPRSDSDRPTGICEAEYRSAEPAAGLHETRSTRKQRGQGRRVDRHEDMDMAGKMSEIDMQGASGHENARSQRKATAARCSAWVRRLAASLFVFAALGTALPAAAQTVVTLISNTGQTNSDVGSLAAYDHAQAFTTGANAAGYTITGVDIQFGDYTGTDSYTVSIWTEVSGSPGSSVNSLTSPSSLTASVVNSYTTSGIDLTASTTYFVHVDSSSTDNNFLRNTTSDNEDSGGQSGWSIADGSVYRGLNDTGAWIPYARSKKILIKGYAKANTNTAPTVANPIPDQAAAAGRAFSYQFPLNTFNDADSGDTLTYTATKADGNLLPTWLGFTAAPRAPSRAPRRPRTWRRSR